MLVLKCVLLSLVSCLAFAEVSPTILSNQVKNRLERVEEFAVIKEEADKLGIKVYLFGGTASAFAHYVRWDLEREAGDEKYQAERFDYDFTNIYRGNQDLDIVVDGTAEQAAQFKHILKRIYPHFEGQKDEWDIRLLREKNGDKEALLDSEEFRNQHTDSNSIGLINLRTEEEEFVFRDLLDWHTEKSNYLYDMSEGRIRYLFNPEHESTKRFREGKNPPVLSAIRYLAKLSQYEAIGLERDLSLVKAIIDQADFSSLSSYAEKKVEEFSLKVLLNSPNVEFAMALIERMGLKAKIQIIGGNVNEERSLNWWMNKEPLKTKDIGQGNGETAQEFFKERGISLTNDFIVSHETDSFEAYESITRSARGEANVFVSRDDIVGEAALHGEGFYTQLGTQGARGSNFTIRFRVKPDARLGHDFDIAQSGQETYLIFKNKAALELIQEDLNIGFYDFMLKLMGSEIKKTDGGYITKLLRKFNRSSIDSNQVELVTRKFLELSNEVSSHAVELWFSIEESRKYPEIFEHLFLNLEEFPYISTGLVKTLVQDEYWKSQPAFKNFIQRKIENLQEGDVSFIIKMIICDPYWSKEIRRQWLEALLEKNRAPLRSYTFLEMRVISDLYTSEGVEVPKNVFLQIFFNPLTIMSTLEYWRYSDKLYEGFKQLSLNSLESVALSVAKTDYFQMAFIMIFAYLKNIEAFSHSEKKSLEHALFGITEKPSNYSLGFTDYIQSAAFEDKVDKKGLKSFRQAFIQALNEEGILEDEKVSSYLKSVMGRRKNRVLHYAIDNRLSSFSKASAVTSITIMLLEYIFSGSVHSAWVLVPFIGPAIADVGVGLSFFRKATIAERGVISAIGRKRSIQKNVVEAGSCQIFLRVNSN